jgi:hypothetical protein
MSIVAPLLQLNIELANNSMGEQRQGKTRQGLEYVLISRETPYRLMDT